MRADVNLTCEHANKDCSSPNSPLVCNLISFMQGASMFNKLLHSNMALGIEKMISKRL